MDQELAQAVFQRWANGDPVYETTLHKAAEALGADPDEALLEARYNQILGQDFAKLAQDPSHRLDQNSLYLHAAAAGFSLGAFEKTASTYPVDIQELIFQKLADREYLPHMEKLKEAVMGALGGEAAPGGGGGGQAQQMPGGMPPPQPGATLQQTQMPQDRYKPTPMAPSQSPASTEGNLATLAEEARNPSPDGPTPQGGPQGGAPGAPTEGGAPPAPSPEEKIMSVAPDIPEQLLPRYAERLSQLEQETGIPMQDPQQVKKFVEQMKKEDSKVLEEAMKNMTDQQSQSFGSSFGGGQQPGAGQPPQGQVPPQQGGQAGPPPDEGAAKVAAVARALVRV